MSEKEYKDKCEMMFKKNAILINENEQLKQQIEKMKNCANCKHYKQPNNYLVGTCKGKYDVEGNNICKEWEMKQCLDEC